MKLVILILSIGVSLSLYAKDNEQKSLYDNYIKTLDLDRLSPKYKKEVLDTINNDVSKSELKKNREKFHQYLARSVKNLSTDKNALNKIISKIKIGFGAKSKKIFSSALGNNDKENQRLKELGPKKRNNKFHAHSIDSTKTLGKNKGIAHLSTEEFANNLEIPQEELVKEEIAVDNKKLSSGDLFTMHTEVYRLIQEGLK